MAGTDDRNRQANALRRGRMLEERAATQAVIKASAAGHAGHAKRSGGSDVLTALVVIAVVIGILASVLAFAR